MKTAITASAVTAAAVIGASTAYGIVGGKDTKVSKYPFVMQVDVDGHNCAGTLVSSTKVVTSVQCLGGVNADKIRVIAGRSDLDNAGGAVREVKDYWNAPDYVDYSTSQGKVNVPANDVAVVTLAKPMPSTYTPARIVSPDYTYPAGTKAHILGYGVTSTQQKKRDNKLRVATLPISSVASCEKAYGGDFDASSMVCAGKPAGGVDTCTGDGGAPLLISDGKEEVLVGVASWGGKECGAPNSPGVYVRLTKFSKELTAQINS